MTLIHIYSGFAQCSTLFIISLLTEKLMMRLLWLRLRRRRWRWTGDVTEEHSPSCPFCGSGQPATFGRRGVWVWGMGMGKGVLVLPHSSTFQAISQPSQAFIINNPPSADRHWSSFLLLFLLHLLPLLPLFPLSLSLSLSLSALPRGLFVLRQ